MHVNALRRGIRFLQPVLVLSLGWTALPASACAGAVSPQLYFTLGDSNPKDGATDVSPEGLFVLSTRASPIPGTTADGPRTLDHRVTVIDLETGEEVPGTFQSSPEGAPGSQNSLSIQSWKAASPLSPHRRYALSEFLSQSQTKRPSNAQGPTERWISFSTGTLATPSLETLGALDVRLESAEGDMFDCRSVDSTCGCTKVGTGPYHKAWMRVPGIRGGNTLGTYHVEIYVTAGTPYDFDHPSVAPTVLDQWTVTSSGGPSELFVDLFKSAGTQDMCFAWRALDDAGHTRSGASVCLETPVNPPMDSPVDLPAKPPVDPPVHVPEPLGLGCSMGGAGQSSAALMLLALLSATLGGRALTRRGWR